MRHAASRFELSRAPSHGSSQAGARRLQGGLWARGRIQLLLAERRTSGTTQRRGPTDREAAPRLSDTTPRVGGSLHPAIAARQAHQGRHGAAV